MAEQLTEQQSAPEASERKPRAKMRGILQKWENTAQVGQVRQEAGWHDVADVEDLTAAKKYVKRNQLTGRFRVMFVSEEFSTSLETKQIVRFA